MRRPAWTYYTSYYLPKKFCTVYRDDALGIQLQVEVKRNTIFFAPKQRAYYFIDGYRKIFRTEARMMRALRRIWSRRRRSAPTRRTSRPSPGAGRTYVRTDERTTVARPLTLASERPVAAP